MRADRRARALGFGGQRRFCSASARAAHRRPISPASCASALRKPTPPGASQLLRPARRRAGHKLTDGGRDTRRGGIGRSRLRGAAAGPAAVLHHLTAPAPLAPPGSRGPSAPTPAAAPPAPTGDAGAGGNELGVANGPLQAHQATARVKSITATVAAVTVKANGRLAMRLDNGQIWLQLQSVEYFSPRPGDKVEVSEGALGSYVMWIPSARRASKVSRIE